MYTFGMLEQNEEHFIGECFLRNRWENILLNDHFGEQSGGHFIGECFFAVENEEHFITWC